MTLLLVMLSYQQSHQVVHQPHHSPQTHQLAHPLHLLSLVVLGLPVSFTTVSILSCISHKIYQVNFFPGQAPAALGGGWTPQRRCEAIASRLELYRPDGLQELQTGRENNENIVCVTTEANSSCRIILTVPRGKDPFVVRNDVFQNLVTADNGQQTVAVNTYGDRNRGSVNELYNLGRTLLGGGNNRVSSSRSGINLKPYLAPQDGGTLRNGGTNNQSQPQTPTRLNPGNFR